MAIFQLRLTTVAYHIDSQQFFPKKRSWPSQLLFFNLSQVSKEDSRYSRRLNGEMNFDQQR
ncbi:hypothetical protein, partial [Spirulina sp.]|uniref:hypothetical protein n=1 Tax=Spirulina sp. TaxID=1157 RepID=UPI003F711568